MTYVSKVTNRRYRSRVMTSQTGKPLNFSLLEPGGNNHLENGLNLGGPFQLDLNAGLLRTRKTIGKKRYSGES